MQHFFLMLLLCVIPVELLAQPVKLADNTEANYAPANSKDIRAAAIIVVDKDTNISDPITIIPLQQKFTDYRVESLVISDKNISSLDKAITFLKEKSEHIILLAYSTATEPTVAALEKLQEKPKLLVLISSIVNEKNEQTFNQQLAEKIKLPLIDIVGLHDYESTLEQAETRKAYLLAQSRDNYRQRMIITAGHSYSNSSGTVVRPIVGDLYRFKILKRNKSDPTLQ